MALPNPVSRRIFLKSSSLLLGAAAVPWAALRTVHAAGITPPQLEQGIQIGDVRADRAVIWSRSDRPTRLLVEYDVSEGFVNPTRVRGPFALDTTDFTARVDLTHLPNDSAIFVRVMFQDLSHDRIVSEAVEGSFRTAPLRNRAIRFLWSGDTAGQGWGINPDFGGMKIYEAMRLTQPDFIHRRTAVMLVSLKDINGTTVFSQELEPFAPGRQ
jgi:alkaline phosphatase D